MPPIPRLAVWLGLAGLLPFLAAALGAWFGPAEWRGAALPALAAYGAVILGFLGAVHWGFALQAPRDAATAPRLVLGVLPALVAWVALLLPAAWALGLLALGILATTATETVAAGRGLLPAGYLRLRWCLSLVGAGCLIAGAYAAS